MGACRHFRIRLAGFLRRHVLSRRLPHGLISVHYLRAHPPHGIAEHRRLWLGALPGLPRPLFFALELCLWLCWMLFGAWRQTWFCLRRLGPEVRREEGIGLARQAVRILALALCHTLSPRDVYRFRLYRREGPRCWPEYVYDRELPVFHGRKSAHLGGPDLESLDLLQDKLRFGERLKGQGLDTVPVLALVPRGEPFDFERHLEYHERLFCKTRRGNRGLGAFVVAKGEDGAVRFFSTGQGGLVSDAFSGPLLREQLEPDDYLIQPFATNYPALADLAGRDDAVTVRYITLQPPQKAIHCYCALLEVPAVRQEGDGRKGEGYVILPIVPETGRVRAFPESCLRADARAQHLALASNLAGTPLPHWEGLCVMAGKAHALFPTIYSIAWDFIITPNGPLLLEGNAGWAAAIPQILRGGLLNDLRI